MSLIKNAILSAVLIIMACAPAFASDTTPEAATHLKAVFEKMLDEQKAVFNGKKTDTLETKGSVTLEQADSYYAITLPHIQMKRADGSRLEIGIISINASPHDTQGVWKMTYAVPTPILAYDAQGNLQTKIEIKGQQAAGLFHEQYEQFSKLDARYSDIAVTNTKNANTITIDAITARFDLETDAQNRWSGPAYVALKNLDVRGENNTKRGHIGEIKADMRMDQYDPAAGMTYRRTFLDLEKQSAFDGEGLSPEQNQQLANALLTLFTQGMNGFDSTYSLSDLTITRPETLAKQSETVNINSAKIGLGINGFLTNQVGVHLNAGYNGFALSSMPEDSKDIIPSTSNIDIKIKNIPFKELMQVGQNTFASAGGDPKTAMQIGMLSLMIKIPALLSQAGTMIEITDNHLGNDLYHVDMNGEIKADIAAANSATATARSTFKGLDALIAATQIIADNPDHEKAEDIGKLRDNLLWLKSVAKVEGPLHVFDFIMDAQGQMLLNGQDVRALRAGAKPTNEQP